MSNDHRHLLIGIVLDVSSSMQRNWRNRRGKNTPRFEVIRDVLNEQLWKISSTTSSERLVEIFCLGVGFQKSVTFTRVNLADGEESETGSEKIEISQTNVICDLLALTEIIPSRSTFDTLERILNEKWNRYAYKILSEIKAGIKEDVYERLKGYLRSHLYQSAYAELHKNWKYKLYTRLRNSSLRRKVNFLQRCFEQLEEYAQRWEQKIEPFSAKESKEYFQRIQQRAKLLFEENKTVYAQFIRETLQDFANHQTQIVLELLTAGHEVDRVLDYFDEKKAFDIAKIIYAKLNREVEDNIRKPVLQDLGTFLKNIWIELRASLDYKEVVSLTEKCVQKYGWEILEPFVQQTIVDLIRNCFKQKAEKMLLYWITLASSREVIRPIQQIRGILPEIVAEDILFSKYLFGTTPIREALSLASMRFLDAKHKDCRKVLIVISDGEFSASDSDQSIRTPIDTFASMLRETGVVIIGLYVTSKNIIGKLVSRSSSHWPEGARLMLEMASVAGDEQTTWLAQYDYQLPPGKKLLLQINESEILSQLLEGILGNEV